MDKQMMVCEVLLDNELWETVQRKMEKLNWAAKDEFYSMRIFLILQDKL